MKSLSIRLKITLWFSAALILIVSLTCAVVLSVGNSVIQKTVRDGLIEAVEANIAEVAFCPSLDDVRLEDNRDQYIEYKGGYLRIDDDFLTRFSGVHISLCSQDAGLMYGENPITRASGELAPEDLRIRTLTVGGVKYYLFDRCLTGQGMEGLWLRGVVSEEQGYAQFAVIARLSLILLPPITLLAIVGGYIIAGRVLRPLRQITQAAAEIGKSSDLKKRVEIGEGNDELYQLAERFNEMFGRLDQAFEAERQFASDASHELRTPMAVIMAQCEFSLESPRNEEEYRNALGVIQRQGRRMSRMIQDMLTFTRLESKAESFAPESIELSELVASLCGDMALIGEKGITLQWSAQENIRISGNRDLLARMLTNLIANAYRYGREDGHIFVALTSDEKTVRLSVADDGIGIAAEEQEKIFRRFYRADSAHSGEGTGMGLAIVQEIVRFHGGNILVKSELGKGSEFLVILPKQ